MKKVRTVGLTWLLIALALAAGALAARGALGSRLPESVAIVLLVPDESALAHPVTQAWLDAAQEEGILLQPLTDNAFIQARAKHKYMPGVILPDTVHRQASDVLVNALYQYANEGGHVMVNFDAAVLDPLQGTYADTQSRLSHLVGVAYALYAHFLEGTTGQGPVLASREAEQTLQIQPGKLDFADNASSTWGELTTYGYKTLSYSHYKTLPAASPPLLKSRDGDAIVASQPYGFGSVLFANLPLGYLKTRTDSYLLHRLLSHFALTMVKQPILSTTPNAQGGMVLNLHVDSNAAQNHLKALEEDGWFDEGPYSIHVTAGPDAYAVGDRMGLNLPHNLWMQAFLKRQHDKGHEVGNHGGWIHNIFGYQVNDHNRARFEPYLDINHRAISMAIEARAVSYSAPMGNQPDWVTDWLRAHEFKAYYSTSDNGLGPTRSYIQGKAAPKSGLWTFPISNFRRIATMDELQAHQLDEKEITDFIHDLFDYVSQHGVARLFYFHPPVSKEYRNALESLRANAHRLKAQGQFRWYSMGQLSDFQNKRLAVQWRATSTQNPQKKMITASSPNSLETMTWIIPKVGPNAPQVTEGKAKIEERDGQWLVIAGDSPSLHVEWTEHP
jgi:phage-related protein